MEEVERLVEVLRKASYNERDPIKQALLALARGPTGAGVRDRLESLRRGELLEIQWELEEVLEASAPPKRAAPPAPAAPPPVAEPAPDPNTPLTAKDLVLMYDDPRGLMLHKAKIGDRWFATQFDPNTGQPQTFELQAAEITQLKTQLHGSPYWAVGSPGAAAAPSPLSAGPAVRGGAGMGGPGMGGRPGKPGPRG